MSSAKGICVNRNRGQWWDSMFLFKCLCIYFFDGGWGGRGRERISSRLCADQREHRAWSQHPKIMTWAKTKSWALNQLSHPDTLWDSMFYICWCRYCKHVLICTSDAEKAVMSASRRETWQLLESLETYRRSQEPWRGFWKPQLLRATGAIMEATATGHVATRKAASERSWKPLRTREETAEAYFHWESLAKSHHGPHHQEPHTRWQVRRLLCFWLYASLPCNPWFSGRG